jgi:hypothetical protein
LENKLKRSELDREIQLNVSFRLQGYAGARWPKMVGPATTRLSDPHAAGSYNSASVGTTTYTNNSWCVEEDVLLTPFHSYI